MEKRILVFIPKIEILIANGVTILAPMCVLKLSKLKKVLILSIQMSRHGPFFVTVFDFRKKMSEKIVTR